MPHTWDPERYLTYADERGRPFVELVARVGAASPASVVDLGCGPGNLTTLLRDRWPNADIRGLDSSPEMIEKARVADPTISFEVADLLAWARESRRPSTCSSPTPPCSGSRAIWTFSDPGEPGAPGRMAGVPGAGQLRGAQPLHPSRPRRRGAVRRPHPRRRGSQQPRPRRLPRPPDRPRLHRRRLGDHVPPRPHRRDPVFTWVSGTGARPTLQALPDDLRTAFEEGFRRRLRAAYRERDGRVVLPFRRVFVVAQVAA